MTAHDTSARYRFAFHFALWDAFKALDEAPLHRAANTAKMLAALLLRAALPVDVLKVVRWHDLTERARFFWPVCFCELLAAPEAELGRLVVALCAPEAAEGLRDGVCVFAKRELEPLVRKTRRDLATPLARLMRDLGAGVS